MELEFFRSFLAIIVVCVEMKRLIDEKMKEMEDLKSKEEHGITEKYKAAMEKGQENLEKYRKLSVMTQNVLRVNKSHQTYINS